MSLNRLGCFLLIIASFLASCAKEETPIPLPPKGEAKIEQISMGGPTYPDQVFYDLDNQKIVFTSLINSWDLAFGSSADGYPIFVNGAKDIYVYNTGQTDITQVVTAPDYNDDKWKWDASEGMDDSTAFGKWGDNGISSKMVYIIKVNPAHKADTFRKFQIIGADNGHYDIVFGDLRSKETQKVTIQLDPNYNFGYLSFNEAKQVNPEPRKDEWDIVFTRYRYIYRELENFPYLVNGVLLNPGKDVDVQATTDSLPSFQEVTSYNIKDAKFSPYRDVIGFDWKSYNINQGKYTVDRNKTFIIQGRKKPLNSARQYYKFHFLDFYDNAGQPGSPTFEFDRLQ
jgi:hypothetical protein